MKRAVKYCGGCNPRYDRTALVRNLEDHLQARLCPAGPGETYDMVYVVCGCPSRCPDLSELTAQRFEFLDHPIEAASITEEA